jgi:nitrogen fixation/metabolism regulation signal transduction histidine kinase
MKAGVILRALTFGCIALGVGLITLLFRASSNNAFFAEQYTWLVGLGLALTVGLSVLIGYQIFYLAQKLRARVFGSKLALRLMAVFALMAVIPGGLVYALSVQFLNRSIDSWFDVPVDKALSAALNLSKGALEGSLNDLARSAQAAASALGERTPAEARDALSGLRVLYGFDEVSLFAGDGTPIEELRAPGAPSPLIVAAQLGDKPTLQELREASETRPQKSIETAPDRGFVLRAVVRVPGGANATQARVLQVLQVAPRGVATDAQAVEAGLNDYTRLGFQRTGLKRLFALTLTLAMLLTLFSALALSFLLSERLSAPLSALAESTRAIAKGDFSKLNPVKSRDEFGVLTQSFNTMTRQLAEASDVVARKQSELENANTYLESILSNLTSGVLTVDERWYVRTINHNAESMLGIEHHALRGLKLSEWGANEPRVAALIEELMAQITVPREKAWEKQLPFDGPQGRRTLLVRGTKLPTTIDSGYVFVFDDITGLIQAQRDAAWGEVARRLAHEIKNPLTPIQLSAERMQLKLADKLPEGERDILARSTNTIVTQVAALKHMVDDFAIYSRSSRLKLAETDINELVRDVLVLYESMNIALSMELAEPMPAVSADPALLRQVLHNLMQNALDALAATPAPRVLVRTIAGDRRGVRVIVEDNGSGIGKDVIGRIFEPYVTTKPKGTGLGLAIVKKIVDEHQGTISIVNIGDAERPHGARVEIFLPWVPEVVSGPQ